MSQFTFISNFLLFGNITDIYILNIQTKVKKTKQQKTGVKCCLVYYHSLVKIAQKHCIFPYQKLETMPEK